MIPRRTVLQGAVVAAGDAQLTHRRPDQYTPDVSSPGSGPAPAQGIFIGRLAIIFGTGTGTGLFVYSGTPGPGNTPILAITTASADPYGNTVTASAITDSGMPLLLYSAAPASGNLIFSMNEGAATTDAFGNTVPKGLTINGTTFQTAGSAPFIQIDGPNNRINFKAAAGGTNPGQLETAGSNGSIDAFADVWWLFPANATSATQRITGQLQLDNEAAPASSANGAVAYSATTGNLEFVSQGDGNSYDTGRLSLVSTSAPQTISSTTPTLINGMSAPVAAGQYRISGVIFCFQGGAAFAQKVGFSGPTINNCRILGTFVNDTAGGTVNYGSANTVTTFTSPAYNLSTNFYFIFEGVISFSASGTFQVVAAEGTAGHTFTINLNSYCDLMPI